VVDNAPNVLAPFRKRVKPGPRIVRKFSWAWLEVWKKLSEYSSASRAVGWNSRVAPRMLVTVGGRSPVEVPQKTTTALLDQNEGNRAGTFVCEGAGGTGGVQGGIVTLGGVAGVIGAPSGPCC